MITELLLKKYFANQCTPDENEYVNLWLQDDSSNHALLQNLLYKDWEAEKDKVDGTELKEILLHDLRNRLYPNHHHNAIVRSPVYRRLWYRITASAAAAFLAGLLIWTISETHRPTAQIAVTTIWDSAENNSAVKKYIELADSTKVWLSPGARIKYAVNKMRKQRSVELDGQAFFDVAHDTSRPFTVYSNDIRTVVLGTCFNVEAYTSEKEIRVSLIKGHVAVDNTRTKVAELHTGEMLTYSKTTHSSIRETLKINKLEDWTSDRQVFNNVPVRDALERLARQYQLTVRFDPGMPPENKRFSTIFHKETPEEMIRNILFITDYKYKIKGKDVVISR